MHILQISFPEPHRQILLQFKGLKAANDQFHELCQALLREEDFAYLKDDYDRRALVDLTSPVSAILTSVDAEKRAGRDTQAAQGPTLASVGGPLPFRQ